MTFQQVVQSELNKLMAEAKAEVRAEGELKGVRMAVADLCEVLGITLTPAQQEYLAGLDLAGIEGLRQHLKQHRAWPG